MYAGFFGIHHKEAQKLIILDNVSKAYSPDVTALNKVSLHIEKGEFVLLWGRAAPAKQRFSNSC